MRSFFENYGIIQNVIKLETILKIFLIFSITTLLFYEPLFANTEENNVVKTRIALEKWVETSQIISKEKKNFKLAEEMLTGRIEIIESEIESLQKKIEETKLSITEADKKRSKLVENNEKFKSVAKAFKDVIVDLETKTREILKRLPDPIVERVKPLSQRFPKNPNETKLSIGERFQNIVGVLNEINKFNREITIISEVRELTDGTSAEVASMYIGIGKAYYANVNGKAVGIGTISPDGWIWKPANESASNIVQAISIMKNESPAAFVQLPIEIQ